MRQVTFQLDVGISLALSYQLIPKRTLTEEQLFGSECFDRFVEKLKEFGCLYRIERISAPELIDGNF